MYDITKDFKCIIGELNIEELIKLQNKFISMENKASKLIIKEIKTELHQRLQMK